MSLRSVKIRSHAATVTPGSPVESEHQKREVKLGVVLHMKCTVLSKSTGTTRPIRLCMHTIYSIQ